MTYLLANHPALTVINPKASATEVNFKLDNDKGYCRASTQKITIRSFPRDKYEFVRNFYFGEADGEMFCNPDPAVVSSSNKHQVTVGYELGDEVTIEGKKFTLKEAANNNIELVAVA